MQDYLETLLAELNHIASLPYSRENEKRIRELTLRIDELARAR
jgi:hypothetical protein